MVEWRREQAAEEGDDGVVNGLQRPAGLRLSVTDDIYFGGTSLCRKAPLNKQELP